MTDAALTAATAAAAHATLAHAAAESRNVNAAQRHARAAGEWLDRLDADAIEAQLRAEAVERLDARVGAGRTDPVPELVLALHAAYDALRLTQEYATDGLLPNLPGWSHYDARLAIGPVLAAHGIIVAYPERTVLNVLDGTEPAPPPATDGCRCLQIKSATPLEPAEWEQVPDCPVHPMTHAPGPECSPTADAVTAERRRQITDEGYLTDHDLAHPAGDLITAGACYLSILHRDGDGNLGLIALDPPVPASWPWDPESWKPSPDPIRNLVKAAALIVAEGDRDHARRARSLDAL